MTTRETRKKLKKEPQDINTLHRYYIYAISMKSHFEEILKNEQNTKEQQIMRDMYMSLWYGMLYVVVEGWQQLKLTDEKINKLLKSNNIKLLKRYRNGTFHFQKNYNDDRFKDFFNEPTTVEWSRSLNKHLGRWFLENLKKQK
ncbi:MAG: hypothetical protein KAI16_00950 [Candidatus Pacebacteria bacterium]|nr:hypothetical protein [Candidatus Paceibacterota bacterium]